MSAIDIPTIPEWLRGKSVFITGASGFIGKVLVEKLLRSTPNVDNIYLLLRSKKGVPTEHRINMITQSPLFDKLKAATPEVLKKLKAVSGDVSLANLGINEKDKKMLQEKVSVVFHVAASVRFDRTLTQALMVNTRSTKDLIELARGMKELEVVVHVSTAYTNCEHETIEEKIYPPRADWRKMIKAAETLDESQLNILTEKLLYTAPNTYIFTKSLAEHLVYEEKDMIPVVIYRPSVVAAALEEPIPGWMDNINSLSGICGGVCKGVLRVYGGPQGVKVDYVPVDVAVNGMIASAWYRAVYVPYHGIKEFDVVFNSTTEKAESKELADFGKAVKDTNPMMDTLWEPYFIFTDNQYSYLFLFLLLHFLPGLILDGLAQLLGKQPRLTKIYRVMYATSVSLRFFVTMNWKFVTTNFKKLETYLSPSDREIFHMRLCTDRWKFMWDTYHGMRQYIFNEPSEITQAALDHRRKIYWLDRSCRVLLVLFIYWLLPLSQIFSTSVNFVNDMTQFLF